MDMSPQNEKKPDLKPVQIEPSWNRYLEAEFLKEYFVNLRHFLNSEYTKKTIFPPKKLVFEAFQACPFPQAKVVILGQDPYHGERQAHGLCFSVQNGTAFPPSLLNIFKEIQKEFAHPIPESGDLRRWAEQGVFLLNSVLTVEKGRAGSHANRGWETFTSRVIEILSEEKSNLVFLLWGAYARKKGELIDRKKHLVLESAHPSPLSAHNGFFGNGHFRKANQYLSQNGISEIDWS